VAILRKARNLEFVQAVFLRTSLTDDGEQNWRTKFSTYGLKAFRKDSSDSLGLPKNHPKEDMLGWGCSSVTARLSSLCPGFCPCTTKQNKTKKNKAC
jgi:hypothetical protein